MFTKRQNLLQILHSLVYKIESSFSGKGTALYAFVDIEDTFDNTAFSSIGMAVEKKGFDPTTIH